MLIKNKLHFQSFKTTNSIKYNLIRKYKNNIWFESTNLKVFL